MLFNILTITVVVAAFAFLLFNFYVQWERMERQCRAYNQGVAEGFAGVPPIMGYGYDEEETREYLRGRMDGWAQRRRLVQQGKLKRVA
jgi:hypothetical protein